MLLHFFFHPRVCAPIAVVQQYIDPALGQQQISPFPLANYIITLLL